MMVLFLIILFGAFIYFDPYIDRSDDRILLWYNSYNGDTCKRDYIVLKDYNENDYFNY